MRLQEVNELSSTCKIPAIVEASRNHLPEEISPSKLP
jgi:hypothetical protein